MGKKRSAADVADAAMRRRRPGHHRLLRRTQRDNALLPDEKPLSPAPSPPCEPWRPRLPYEQHPYKEPFRHTNFFGNKVPVQSAPGNPQNPSSEQHKSKSNRVKIKVRCRSPPKDDEDPTSDQHFMFPEYPKKCNINGIIPPSTSIRNVTECETESKIDPTSRVGCSDLVDLPKERLLELAERCFPRKRGKDHMDALKSKQRRHLEGGGPEPIMKKGYWTAEDLKFLKKIQDDDDARKTTAGCYGERADCESGEGPS